MGNPDIVAGIVVACLAVIIPAGITIIATEGDTKKAAIAFTWPIWIVFYILACLIVESVKFLKSKSKEMWE